MKLLPLLALGAPILVAVIKTALPQIPKKYIPMLAPMLGAVAEILYRLSANPDANLPEGSIVLAAAAGVAVREVIDQWRKDGLDPFAGSCALALCLGIAGMGATGCSINKNLTPAEKVVNNCTVAAEIYDPIQQAIEQALASPIADGADTRRVLKAADAEATAAINDCLPPRKVVTNPKWRFQFAPSPRRRAPLCRSCPDS